MSSFGFGDDDDDDDGVFDTQFNFPEEAKCLTQVSDMEESQVMAMVESESFRSTSTTQLLKRVRRSDSNSPPREVPNKYRRVDFFPNRQEAEEEDVVQIQKEPNPPPIVNRQDDEVSVITPLKRRIPGPAGNVSRDPQDTSETNKSGNRIRHPLYRHLQGQSARQSAVTGDNEVFFKPPWLKLLFTWELPPFHDSETVELLDYNIKYVLLFGYHKRVPQLFVVIKDVNSTDIETTVTFRDPTGEMEGTIHKSVTEKWGADIRIGSVLCLKTVTVFNPTPFAHYLNVTSETIVDVIPSDCKAPPMDNAIQEKLKRMDPACIYKKRRELETNDPRTLHRLAQQQMRTLQQRREANLRNGSLSFHSAPSAPSPGRSRGGSRGGARGGARGGFRGRGSSRGRGRGGTNSSSTETPTRPSFATPRKTPTQQSARQAQQRASPTSNRSSSSSPSSSNLTQTTLFQSSQQTPPINRPQPSPSTPRSRTNPSSSSVMFSSRNNPPRGSPAQVRAPTPRTPVSAQSPAPVRSPAPTRPPVSNRPPVATHSPAPVRSPAPTRPPVSNRPPVANHSPAPTRPPVSNRPPVANHSPAPVRSPAPTRPPVSNRPPISSHSPAPTRSPAPSRSPVPNRSPTSSPSSSPSLATSRSPTSTPPPASASSTAQPQQSAAFGFGFEEDEDEIDSMFAGIDDNLIAMWSQQSQN